MERETVGGESAVRPPRWPRRRSRSASPRAPRRSSAAAGCRAGRRPAASCPRPAARSSACCARRRPRPPSRGFACSWPRTSLKSWMSAASGLLERRGGARMPDRVGDRTLVGCDRDPVTQRIDGDRPPVPRSARPPRRQRSAPRSARPMRRGRRRPRRARHARAAARHRARARRGKSVSCTALSQICPVATSIPTAIGRS